MSTVRTTPATARTDVPAVPQGVDPVVPPRPATDGLRGLRGLRWLGAGLAAGAVTYGGAFLVAGAQASGQGSFLIDVTGLVFQLGVFCLLVAMWRTRATGTSRAARGLVLAEFVVLGVATLQSALTLPARGGEWSAAAQALDVFWPLSMLGMAVLGIKVAVAGRWRGALRAWPVVAETWIFVAIPAGLLLGPVLGGAVAGAHFVVGYGVLGVLLAVRPDLTRR